MTTVPNDYDLAPNQFRDPVLWITSTAYADGRPPITVDCSDVVMDSYLGEGDKQAIKSFGHDPVTGVHFLLTRSGTTVHTDKAYLRYTHQLVLRNDGNRLRGMPKFDSEDPSRWHIPMEPGVLYCLDTHSPHQGVPDPRFPTRDRSRGMKAVIAVDRSTPLDPSDALRLCETYLVKQMSEFPFDPTAKFLKWKEPSPKPAGWR
jgi:hypothetical protein